MTVVAVAVAVAVTAVASGAASAVSRGVVASPTVTGPVTGGNGTIVVRTTSFPLSDVGYTQSEFFLSGTATSYVSTADLGSDGRWQAVPAGTASYTTRIVAYRPADPARFNGSVVVEWLNVSGGNDVGVEWGYSHNELIREGYAWIGVSAQAVGVSGTVAADPVRYTALSHPGDSYSYDIFSQAGQAIRASASAILGGLRPRALLAEGESQSAFRLTTYINAVQPLAHVYDGFLINSRGGGSAPLSQAPQADIPTPPVVHFRPDAGAPVLAVQTESDVTLLGYLAARQDDSAAFRLWEVTGTAHGDDYILIIGAGDDGSGAAGLTQLNSMLDPPNGLPGFTCEKPINTGPAHYVLDAAQYALNRWITARVAPPQAPRLQVTSDGTFVVDAHGNVVGGVRTPPVDAPVATLSGLGQTGTSSFCFLFGTTTPFGADALAALYPTHQQFVARWTAATASGVAAGFIRPADGAELAVAAYQSTIGGQG